MKVLVTGGAGFIGSNIVEALVKKKFEVIVLDDLFLGKKENLEDVWGKIEFYKGDVRNSKLVNKLLKGCDFVFHQAAHSSAPMFDDDPRLGLDVNVNGFMNVLSAARDFNVKRIIFATTSSIYARLSPPHREDMKLTPSSFYALSFFIRENIAKLYWQKWGLESVGLRYFSIYGPHEQAKGRFANIITQFLWEIKEKRCPIIYGDGTQTRDFTYISDVIQANLLAMESNKVMEAEIFNVGTGKSASFNRIIELLNQMLGTVIQPKKIQNPIKNYVEHTLADISKIKRELGYEVTVSLEEGIKKMIEVYK